MRLGSSGSQHMQQALFTSKRVLPLPEENSMIINNENECSQVNLLIKDLKPRQANPETYHIQEPEFPETSGRLGML